MSDNNMMKRQSNPVTIWDLFSRPLSSFADFSPLSAMANDDFKVDIKEDDKGYQLTADMPGVKKEDLKVDFEDGVLTISAQHHTEREEQDKDSGYLLRERTSGSYSRSFSFDGADPQKIEASFSDGVLSITLGKQEQVSKATSIEIK